MSELPDIDALWDYADNSGSERRFRETLALAERSRDDAYLAELLTQLARAAGRQSRFDEAHGLLDRAGGIATAEMSRAWTRLRLERGRLHNSSGDPAGALPHFRDAFDLARESGLHKLAVDAIHMIAIAVPTPAQQVEWNLRGIALAEELGQRRWLRAFYNNLGEAYAAQQDHALALETFRKLLALDEELGLPPDMMAQKDVARMLRLLGRHDEALAILAPIRERLDAANSPNGWIDFEVAECLLTRGLAGHASALFARAYGSLKDDAWLGRHDPAMLERMRTLSHT